MKIIASTLLISSLLFLVSCEKSTEPAIEKPIEMAITFDDLPASSLASIEKMASALNQYQVPEPYGFVNGSYIYKRGVDSAAKLAILDYWLQQGFLLGNHSFNHVAIKQQKSLAEAQKNSQMNEQVMAQLERYNNRTPKDDRVYRYTFLDEGFNSEIGTDFRNYLTTAGYKIAHVSINPADWVWAEKYEVCRQKNDTAAMNSLKSAFISYTLEVLKSRQEASQMLLQREIKHILLLHFSEFTADVLEPLLAALSQTGVKFISLDEAMSDPLYQQHQQQTLPKQSDILNKLALMQRQYTFSTPTQPQQPENFTQLCL
ncbi:MAG: polysaccharide deacetylase family protein [Gammaproteobacteria bacterium]|nr:polysaccharide deacetylase family protein [Gammaproteobacteria bacterium]MCF6229438.1 polysaccharide deacetylase family protein [Gammaproteobacteria bacterium]